jgi:cell division protein FtsI (penicillin-binding protein 3)
MSKTETAKHADDMVPLRLRGQNRIRLVTMIFIAAYLTIGAQLAHIVATKPPEHRSQELVAQEERVPRPDIVDRNGVVVATDIAVSSLYADPRKILDLDETVEALTATVPDLDARQLRQKLQQPGRAFVWLKRQVSPEERNAVYNLGLPGVGYVNERRRVYPQGRLMAHAVGYVDVDTKGIAGIEKYLDDQGAIYTASLNDPSSAIAAPAQISLDVRVQHVLADEVGAAIRKFHAIAGGGIVMDVQSGEILAMVSLPDFDPNAEDKKIGGKQQNKMTSGVYELGSVIKAVTFAMALDSGKVTLNSSYDARTPLVIGNQRIDDYRGQHRILTLPEIFTYSSNIGTARMALDIGIDKHLAFLRKVGLLDRMQTELPESAKPLLPKHWGRLVSATAAFGHGFAVQPLQGLTVVAGLLNDGKMLQPTFLKRTVEEADVMAQQVVSPKTSATLRYLFRLNAEKGSAAKANVPGYMVGGKTGTAEKVVAGRYSSNNRLTSFIGAFPMSKPRYAMIFMLDEPQPLAETFGFATSGWNAVPAGGRVIERIAPILGVEPHLTQVDLEKLGQIAAKEKASVKP